MFLSSDPATDHSTAHRAAMTWRWCVLCLDCHRDCWGVTETVFFVPLTEARVSGCMFMVVSKVEQSPQSLDILELRMNLCKVSKDP